MYFKYAILLQYCISLAPLYNIAIRIVFGKKIRGGARPVRPPLNPPLLIYWRYKLVNVLTDMHACSQAAMLLVWNLIKWWFSYGFPSYVCTVFLADWCSICILVRSSSLICTFSFPFLLWRLGFFCICFKSVRQKIRLSDLIIFDTEMVQVAESLFMNPFILYRLYHYADD